MRKIFYLFALVLLFAGGCDARKENAPALADDKIYFFYYNECPYCHDAMDYMNAEYPRTNMSAPICNKRSAPAYSGAFLLQLAAGLLY